MHRHRCSSRVQDLKRSIELQIEDVARLIDDGNNGREATQLLNKLTIELIAAALGLWVKRDERPGGAVISSGAGRAIQDYRSVCDPEQLSVLARIFDDAVAALPEGMRTPDNRRQIAKLILGRAVIAEFELGLLIRFVVAVASAV
ncbi:NolY [Bradyrhizobium tunisiense]|uniref:NolY n=1 Tax=Bradyrhizobium tunisiense TaxID=3278709 RepID=UPI0035D9CDB3